MGCCESVPAGARGKREPPRVLAPANFGDTPLRLYAEALNPRLRTKSEKKKLSFECGRRERALSLHKLIGSSRPKTPQRVSDEEAQTIVQLLTSAKAPLVLFAATPHCDSESAVMMRLDIRGADPFVVDMGDQSRLGDQPLWRALRAKSDISMNAVPVMYCRGKRIVGGSVTELLKSLDRYLRGSVKQALRIGELEVYDASVDAWVAGELELRSYKPSHGTDWRFAPFSGRFGGKLTAHFGDVCAVRPSGDEYNYDPRCFEVECRGGQRMLLRSANAEDAAEWMEFLDPGSGASSPDIARDQKRRAEREFRCTEGVPPDRASQAKAKLLERWQQEVGEAAASEWLQELSSLLESCPAATARITYSGEGFMDVIPPLQKSLCLDTHFAVIC